jgi:hypothetical protein
MPHVRACVRARSPGLMVPGSDGGGQGASPRAARRSVGFTSAGVDTEATMARQSMPGIGSMGTPSAQGSPVSHNWNARGRARALGFGGRPRSMDEPNYQKQQQQQQHAIAPPKAQLPASPSRFAWGGATAAAGRDRASRGRAEFGFEEGGDPKQQQHPRYAFAVPAPPPKAQLAVAPSRFAWGGAAAAAGRVSTPDTLQAQAGDASGSPGGGATASPFVAPLDALSQWTRPYFSTSSPPAAAPRRASRPPAAGDAGSAFPSSSPSARGGEFGFVRARYHSTSGAPVDGTSASGEALNPRRYASIARDDAASRAVAAGAAGSKQLPPGVAEDAEGEAAAIEHGGGDVVTFFSTVHEAPRAGDGDGSRDEGGAVSRPGTAAGISMLVRAGAGATGAQLTHIRQ